jgi:[ribosomal protein S5]-alanine N-acetyltransferase
MGHSGDVSTPTIRTQRLELRAFSRADAPDVFAYASNPNVARFTSWSPHSSLAETEAWLDRATQDSPEERGHLWAITLAGEGRAIGAIEFSLLGADVAEFHYVLSEQHWNRGLVTEAARAVLAWGLDRWPEVQRIVTRAVADNAASLRVMSRCGLAFERVVETKWAKLDAPVSQHEYAGSREEVLRRVR